jgi:hypothetical protein
MARVHNAIIQILHGRWSTLVALAEAAGPPNLSSRPDVTTLTVMLQAPTGVPINWILLSNYEVLWYAEITRVAITGSRGVMITPRLLAAGVPPVLGGPQHAVPGVAQNNIPCLVGGSLSAGLSVLHGGVAVRHLIP